MITKTADWIIDLGPEGGAEGSLIVAQSTPEKLVLAEKSYPGRFLKQYLS